MKVTGPVSYQAFPAQAGEVYVGRAWVRTPSSDQEGSWVDGSKATVRVEFWDREKRISYYEADPVTSANQAWQELAVATKPAASGIVAVRFVCYLEKPHREGLSVANFDDCFLAKDDQPTPLPGLSLSRKVLGFGFEGDVRTLEITNIGPGPLHWSVGAQPGWLVVSPTGGDLAPGQAATISMTVDRTGSPGPYQGAVHLLSDHGEADIAVYLSIRRHEPIRQPGAVRVDGHQLMVGKRLPDGRLAAEQPFAIAGVCWSSADVETPADPGQRQKEFARWYEVDVPMIRAMNANTVYTFLDLGTDDGAMSILDYLYENGIMAIVTVDWGTNDIDRAVQIVTRYRTHPAVLMWALGNEWNINLYHGRFASLREAAEATERVARRIKELDANHPVASIYGEINIPPDQPLSTTRDIVTRICPSVDVWGLNLYRGASFGDVFEQWRALSDKPFFMAEWGTDSFATDSWWPPQGSEDELAQKDFILALWAELEAALSSVDPTNVCLGGTIFAWNDEWHKVTDADGGSPMTHDHGGFVTEWNPSAHPDGFANEEYFGLVRIDRTPKVAYAALQARFAPIPAPYIPPADSTGVQGSDVECAPTAFALGQNYPNPFNPQTVIPYHLPEQTGVHLAVFNLLGQPLRILVDQIQPPGTYAVVWDGRDDDGQVVAGGVFLSCLSAGHYEAVRKLVLAR